MLQLILNKYFNHIYSHHLDLSQGLQHLQYLRHLKIAYHSKDFAGVEEIKGQSGYQVEEKPPSHVVESDLARLRHDLALLVHERRPEV